MVLAAIFGAAGLLAIGLLYRSLAAIVLDEEAAMVAGVPVKALNLLLLIDRAEVAFYTAALENAVLSG